MTTSFQSSRAYTQTKSSLQNSQNTRQSQNLFNKVQKLQDLLETVQTDLYSLNQEAHSVKYQKQHVQQYLNSKAEETRQRLLKQLNGFETQIKKRIDHSKQETQKIDQQIKKIKEVQISAVQMILQLQRRAQQLEIQLGA